MKTLLVDGKRVVEATQGERQTLTKALVIFDFVGVTHQDAAVRAKAQAAFEAAGDVMKALTVEAEEAAPAPTPAAPPAKEDKKGSKAAGEAATAK